MKADILHRALGLTSEDVSELARIDKHESCYPFRVGERLRKRGLAERTTNYVVRSEYADAGDVHRQSTHKKPFVQHTWYSTEAGGLILEIVKEHTTT